MDYFWRGLAAWWRDVLADLNANLPLLTLLAIAGAIWWMLRRAQRGGTLQIEQVFKDDAGKTSAARIVYLIAFAICSWVLMTALVTKHPSFVQMLDSYLLAFVAAFMWNKGAEVAGRFGAPAGGPPPEQQPGPPPQRAEGDVAP